MGKRTMAAKIKVGDRYGRHVVDSPLFYERNETRQVAYCWCACDCGSRTKVACHCLLGGDSKSCGCLRAVVTGARNTKHWFAGTRIYRTWASIVGRCENPKNHAYKDYGGRGITMCREWRGSFEAFFDWAMVNGYEHSLTIDRHPDNNGNYEPSNCRWVDEISQSNNRRSNRIEEAFGERKTLMEWSRDPRCKVNYQCLHRRLRAGKHIETAITEPADVSRHHKSRRHVA